MTNLPAPRALAARCQTPLRINSQTEKKNNLLTLLLGNANINLALTRSSFHKQDVIRLRGCTYKF
jgi:hypothetical protein